MKGKGILNTRSNEISYANHIYEFLQFYREHRLLCDQISGLKPDNYGSGINQKSVIINRNNFDEAIKKVRSFIISNLNYIPDKNTVKILNDNSIKLWHEYDSDKEYKEFIRLNKLGTSLDYKFTQKYFYYLVSCFEITSLLCENLQQTLMVSPYHIRKNLDYMDSSSFSEELFSYKKEIADELSFFRFEDLEKNLKKTMSYYYTYRYIMTKEIMDYVDKIIFRLIKFYLLDDTLQTIYFLKQDKINVNLDELKQNSNICHEILLEIYNVTNEGLSDRNILPKVRKNVLVDRWGI